MSMSTPTEQPLEMLHRYRLLVTLQQHAWWALHVTDEMKDIAEDLLPSHLFDPLCFHPGDLSKVLSWCEKELSRLALNFEASQEQEVEC